MEHEITSLQNALVKRVVMLQQKSAARRREGRFVVEGLRELEHCAAAGYAVESLFLCPDICPTPPAIAARQTYCVSRPVYEKMAYRDSTEGVVAVVEARSHSLSDLSLKEDALVVVLESVEKPGNLGAILRSADAAGADAVIVSDALTDLYNPNLIRASIGALFSVQTAVAPTDETIAFLKAHNIQILTAQLQDSLPYYASNMKRATALVMGTESTGLSQAWRHAADAHIRIPMLGRLDSLNVSVSTAILLFEAVRQRQA